MINISLHHIEIAYLDEPILKGVDLEIHANDRIGLVGCNGSGKTTIFNIISLHTKPDKGVLTIGKHIRVGYLDQIPSFPESYTVYQVLTGAFSSLIGLKIKMRQLEVEMSKGTGDSLGQLTETYGRLQSEYESRDGYNIETKIEQICTGLKIGKDVQQRRFGTLSGGEKSIVVLAMILLQNCDVLLLDEPTNHLDIERLEWLEAFIAQFKGSVMVISHDRYFLDRSVTKIVELSGGVTTLYHGHYSDYLVSKEKEIALGLQRFNNQEKQIKAMQDAIKRFREWGRRSDDPSMFKKAANMEKRIEKMEKVNKPMTDQKQMGLNFKTADRSGKIVLRLENVSKGFQSTLLFADVSCEVHFKEHVAIIGENGSGKTTLMGMIEGKVLPDTGTVYIGANVSMGVLEQEIHFSNPADTVIHLFRSQVPVDEGKARSLLAKYLFTGNDVFKRLDDLSGGERVRLKLCLISHQDVNFLILDEPTNHLDIQSREVFENAIRNFSGTIVFISHDRFFINRVASGILAIENRHLVSYPGNYDAYKRTRNKVAQEDATKQYLNEPTKDKDPLPDKNKKKDMSKNRVQNRKKEKQRMEIRLAELDEEIERINGEALYFPDDYEKQMGLFNEKETLKQEADLLLEALIRLEE